MHYKSLPVPVTSSSHCAHKTLCNLGCIIKQNSGDDKIKVGFWTLRHRFIWVCTHFFFFVLLKHRVMWEGKLWKRSGERRGKGTADSKMTELNSARLSVGARDFVQLWGSLGFELFLLTPSSAYQGRKAFEAWMTYLFIFYYQSKLTRLIKI